MIGLPRVETPAFVLERRTRHKPLSSYFEDETLDREGSIDRETESQGGSKQVGNVGTTAGSANLEIPADHMVNPTPSDDETSATGKSNFGHQLMPYADVTSIESETEADLKAFTQPAAKRKYPGHSGSSNKRQKLPVEDDEDSITESDDGHCMSPRISLFASD